MGRIGRLWAAWRWRFACRRQDGFLHKDGVERPSYRRLSRAELDRLARPSLGRAEADKLGGGDSRGRLETGPADGELSGRKATDGRPCGDKRVAARRAAGDTGSGAARERRGKKMKNKVIWTVLGFLAGAAAAAWWFCKELSEAFNGLF